MRKNSESAGEIANSAGEPRRVERLYLLSPLVALANTMLGKFCGRKFSAALPQLGKLTCPSLHFVTLHARLPPVQGARMFLDIGVSLAFAILVDARLTFPLRVGNEFARRIGAFQKLLRKAARLLDHERRAVIFPQANCVINLIRLDGHEYESNDRHDDLLVFGSPRILFRLS